jgi:hypothetical protein
VTFTTGQGVKNRFGNQTHGGFPSCGRELPLGTTLRELLEAAGGVPKGVMVIFPGASSTALVPSQLDTLQRGTRPPTSTRPWPGRGGRRTGRSAPCRPGPAS